MPDAMTIFQGAATAVQAVSAGIIAWLTYSLSRSTGRYADTAGSQFEEMGLQRHAMGEQLDQMKLQREEMASQRKEMELQREAMGLQVHEMVREREAELRPAVHIDAGRVINEGESAPFHMLLGFALRNVGKGPALSVYGYLTHPQFKGFRHGVMKVRRGHRLETGVKVEQVEFEERELESTSGPILLSPGDEIEIALMTGEGSAGPELRAEGGQLIVEYRDLLGNWWRTRMQVRVGCTSSAGRYYNCAVVPQDQTEQFRRIVAPRIKQETVAVDESPWEADELADEN